MAWHAAARQAAVSVAEQVRERDNRRRTRSQRCGQGAGGAAMAAMPRTRWTNLTRRLGLDGNPLRPRSDLMQRWLLPAAIGLFVALCPVVAGLTGMWVQADNAAVAHAKLSWHSVTAVLLRAVPGPAESDHGANTWMTWTPAAVDRGRSAAHWRCPCGCQVERGQQADRVAESGRTAADATADGGAGQRSCSRRHADGTSGAGCSAHRIVLAGPAGSVPATARGLGDRVADRGPALEPSGLNRPHCHLLT